MEKILACFKMSAQNYLSTERRLIRRSGLQWAIEGLAVRRFLRKARWIGLVGLGAASAASLMSNAPAQAPSIAAEPATIGGLPGFRRLNQEQYTRSIEQIFGAGLKVPGRFDPPLRTHGLMAIGDGTVGPITRRLQTRYFDVVKGKDETHPEWLTYV